jgi:hypothetical protein
MMSLTQYFDTLQVGKNMLTDTEHRAPLVKHHAMKIYGGVEVKVVNVPRASLVKNHAMKMYGGVEVRLHHSWSQLQVEV